MGRDRRNEGRGEHFAAMLRSTLESEAWRALPSAAQALYPFLKLEWRGPKANNNGQIRLSVREAAEKMGRDKDTAAVAFHALQAKGFLVVTEAAFLGVTGRASAPAFEITEIALPHQAAPRKLFLKWTPGVDFPVHKAVIHNRKGRYRRSEPCLKNADILYLKVGRRDE